MHEAGGRVIETDLTAGLPENRVKQEVLHESLLPVAPLAYSFGPVSQGFSDPSNEISWWQI
jgi:hypothetical protein